MVTYAPVDGHKTVHERINDHGMNYTSTHNSASEPKQGSEIKTQLVRYPIQTNLSNIMT